MMDTPTVQIGSGKPKSIMLEAVVIRADGTRENLGVVSYWHRNPLKRAWFRIKQHFRGNNFYFLKEQK